jgi:hypothetical protein
MSDTVPTDEQCAEMRIAVYDAHQRFPIPAPQVIHNACIRAGAAWAQEAAQPVADVVAESFERELAHVINRFSVENISNTPDFVLARFLRLALASFDAATIERTHWYRPKEAAPPAAPVEPPAPDAVAALRELVELEDSRREFDHETPDEDFVRHHTLAQAAWAAARAVLQSLTKEG